MEKAFTEMYELMDLTASYIESVSKIYAVFPAELVTYAERIRELQKRIGRGAYDNQKSS
ncbi:MAG: hypothetical protein IJP69_04470 [Synergistaceae bacterium]|nr:hypothetical protein [Synergistaceae bacterium]MBR0234330.1 hypothetical protein [Synergistaceae bacterium]